MENIEMPDTPELSGVGPVDLPPLGTPSESASPVNDGAPKRRRRRSRAKTETPAEPATTDERPAPTPEELERLSSALGLGFKIGADLAAAARGAHWALRDEEVKALGDAWAHALAPYMGTAGKYMPFALAIVTTVGVALPRIQADANATRISPPPAPNVETILAEARTTEVAAVIPIDPPRRRNGQ